MVAFQLRVKQGNQAASTFKMAARKLFIMVYLGGNDYIFHPKEDHSRYWTIFVNYML